MELCFVVAAPLVYRRQSQLKVHYQWWDYWRFITKSIILLSLLIGVVATIVLQTPPFSSSSDSRAHGPLVFVVPQEIAFYCVFFLFALMGVCLASIEACSIPLISYLYERHNSELRHRKSPLGLLSSARHIGIIFGGTALCALSDAVSSRDIAFVFYGLSLSLLCFVVVVWSLPRIIDWCRYHCGRSKSSGAKQASKKNTFKPFSLRGILGNAEDDGVISETSTEMEENENNDDEQKKNLLRDSMAYLYTQNFNNLAKVEPDNATGIQEYNVIAFFFSQTLF
ncbi:hypothetical protein RFI_30724 [Reticulomyxa filosa]|uniref:Uncharacterized protein n=1 Tax=Reticulomyxa filosa TaxID=46433 RepID=X6LYF7_RETFI|nr:hypothetical protein RFI_30724 [Reticulomyxa filosa]|eukprot:ETO06669.1 hypothetical protein RFI_30724 [Reticulomyxa filosa]